MSTSSSSSPQSESGIIAATAAADNVNDNANANDYLVELGILNDGLPANVDDMGNTAAAAADDDDDDDDMEVCDDDNIGDPSSFDIPALPPLLDDDDDVNGVQNVPLIAAANTTTAKKAPPPTPLAIVLPSYKSSLHFRTDLSKSDRDSHPCGILHFTRILRRGCGGGGSSSRIRGAGAAAAPEEHVFAWIAHYHNPTHLNNTLLHLQRFGFVTVAPPPSSEKIIDVNPPATVNTTNNNAAANNTNTTVTFLPYSSRRSWIEKYPCAFPHVYCGENGVVSGYPYWSEGGGTDDIIRGGGGGGSRGGLGNYYDRIFQNMNHHQHPLSDTSSSSLAAAGIASATSTAATAATTTTIEEVQANNSIVLFANATETNLTTSLMSTIISTTNRGRKRKKIFPTAHLPNEERDALHMEIYKYFEWLHNSLAVVVAATSTSATGGSGSVEATTTTAAAAEAAGWYDDDNDEDNDELGGRSSRKRKDRSSSGGRNTSNSTYGGGIDTSSLHQLMKCMEATFKVIGNSQRTSSQPAASSELQSSLTTTTSTTTSPTTPMPFLEEALSEPLRKLAVIAKQNSDNQPRSRWKNDRRGSITSTSGGIGGVNNNTGVHYFEDMFARLLQFQQEHGHVNVPQKYAPDGQLGSWVANIRSKRKQMSKRGEEFEPDIVPTTIPHPAEYDDLVVDDDDENNGNTTNFEDDDDGNIALGDDDDDVVSGGGGDQGDVLGGGGGGSKNFNSKKRIRQGGRQRLTQERIHRLDTIGFQWVVSNSNTKSWEERFEDLKEYQQYHGTTRVPRSSGTLGEWVHMQRRLYNKKDKNFLATRAPLLDAIGFEWHPRKYALVSWEDNFNRLVEFGQMHRHYNVQSPFPDDYPGDIEDQDAEMVEMHRLAKWVKRIHSEYRSYAAGKESRMLTDARVMQLREIGFHFA